MQSSHRAESLLWYLQKVDNSHRMVKRMNDESQKAINDAAKAVSPIRPLPILLSGPMPPYGAAWCATCVMIYIGTISNEPELHAYVISLAEAAAEAGANFVSIDLKDRDDLQLQPAMTVAPSSFFTEPMPVCWTHVKGFRHLTREEEKEMGPRRSQMQETQRLITGTAHKPVGDQL
jgi:hypothetical protein